MTKNPAARSSLKGLVERLDNLHVPALSDSLDQLGIRKSVLAPSIRPLKAGSRAAGTALTVRAVPASGELGDPVDTYRGIARAVDALETGDVMVVSTCHHGSYWGELMATASKLKGAVGLVADAYARDTKALERLDFPSFVAGVSAQDSVGRMDVEAVKVEIECAGVRVQQGDLILADQDGVVVVPLDHAEEVIAQAEEKCSKEDIVRERLREGMSITDAVATYGIL